MGHTDHCDSPPYVRMWRNGTKTTFPSFAYEAHYWQVILERLQQGEHVLHMDLDAIPVGDPLAPIAKSDHQADILSPYSLKNQIDQQYVLYRSTHVVQSIISSFAVVWDNWLKSRQSCLLNAPLRLPMPEAQLALRNYIDKYNPEGCWKLCKTHTGEFFTRNLTQQNTILQFGQPGQCSYPENDVCHGRHGLASYCTKEEFEEAERHS